MPILKLVSWYQIPWYLIPQLADPPGILLHSLMIRAVPPDRGRCADGCAQDSPYELLTTGPPADQADSGRTAAAACTPLLQRHHAGETLTGERLGSRPAAASRQRMRERADGLSKGRGES
jgi:hypothetical protein